MPALLCFGRTWREQEERTLLQTLESLFLLLQLFGSGMRATDARPGSKTLLQVHAIDPPGDMQSELVHFTNDREASRSADDFSRAAVPTPPRKLPKTCLISLDMSSLSSVVLRKRKPSSARGAWYVLLPPDC